MKLIVDNILDLLALYPEDKVNDLLQVFSCTKNGEVEGFVREKAIDFAKKGLAITYLVYAEDGDLLGIFTLASKVLSISTRNLSSKVLRKLREFGNYDEPAQQIDAPSILIAQIGKNDSCRTNLSGKNLIQLAEQKASGSLHDVGGRIVYLECEHKEVLFDFYESCGYRNVGERIQRHDKHDMTDILYRIYLKFINPMKWQMEPKLLVEGGSSDCN